MKPIPATTHQLFMLNRKRLRGALTSLDLVICDLEDREKRDPQNFRFADTTFAMADVIEKLVKIARKV